jgi:hypothetical protein
MKILVYKQPKMGKMSITNNINLSVSYLTTYFKQ